MGERAQRSLHRLGVREHDREGTGAVAQPDDALAPMHDLHAGIGLVEVGAGDRLNPDWIYAYLLKPDVFKPVKMMPVFVGLLSEKDMQNVSAFVANFGEAE